MSLREDVNFANTGATKTSRVTVPAGEVTQIVKHNYRRVSISIKILATATEMSFSSPLIQGVTSWVTTAANEQFNYDVSRQGHLAQCEVSAYAAAGTTAYITESFLPE